MLPEVKRSRGMGEGRGLGGGQSGLACGDNKEDSRLAHISHPSWNFCSLHNAMSTMQEYHVRDDERWKQLEMSGKNYYQVITNKSTKK